MIFRIHHKLRGGHISMALFSAPAADQTFGLCGTLVMRPEEFAAFKGVIEAGSDAEHRTIEFIEDKS